MRICIIAHNAYGAMTGEKSGHIGGVERQTSLLATWLMRRGHSVSVITWGNDNPDDELHSGIKIIKLCRAEEGFPVVRFAYPRSYSLLSALMRANADLYFHNCAEDITGIIALFCKIRKRPFIYSVASDIDCLASIPTLDWHERVLYKYGIRNASAIFTQTKHQKKLLSANFLLESTRIPMPATPKKTLLGINTEERRQIKKVIFVGRIHPIKRINIFLELAQRCKEYVFEVIGPFDMEPSEIEKILEQIEKLPNLEYLGRVDVTQMHNVYIQSSLLCCTSEYEGFPNTFLEAWGYGIPVISTFDPDNLIVKEELGVSASTLDELEAGIRTVLHSPDKYRALSENAITYVEKNHNGEKIYEHMEKEFLRLNKSY